MDKPVSKEALVAAQQYIEKYDWNTGVIIDLAEMLTAHAASTRAEVIEECARVAERFKGWEVTGAEEDHSWKFIAQEIRSLGEKNGGGA